MPLKIDHRLNARQLVPRLKHVFELSAHKILSLERSWHPEQGTPVCTVKGRYTSRGWTEWTQGFQFGSAILQFDATREARFLKLGRLKTISLMATHVSHVGVHDHGFNNVSTYGNLWRLMREGAIPWQEDEKDFYELALKVSGAVQAARWTPLAGGGGFIYSFNGPHSLFVDTVRSLRSLALAHQLGHVLMGERDQPVSLLRRLLDHGESTARFNIYYGEGRDRYDVRGRTAHECLFNVNDGTYRCPNTQQGYSPFSTWTRGLAWGLLGYAEQLEYLDTLKTAPPRPLAVEPGTATPGGLTGTLTESRAVFLKAALATADFYIDHACLDGVPMWDTGAPNLHRLGDYANRPADPFNPWEPVDSSAAAIAAQGLIRLGNWLHRHRQARAATRCRQAGLTVARTLFDEPYLSCDPRHQGLLLHSVYHRPNNWDHVPAGQKVPNGESSMWGDYHARELALLLWREAHDEPCPRFFGP